MWGPMRAQRRGHAAAAADDDRPRVRDPLQDPVRLGHRAAPARRQHAPTRSTSSACAIGRTQLIVIIVGFVVLVAVGLMLRSTLLGKQMRALSDNLDLAETTGSTPRG